MEVVALISDLHGNRLALEAVLADIESLMVTKIYCLGDLVGYGPDPNGVIDLVRLQGIQSILGNYDEGIAWEKGDCGCFYPDEEARRLGTASYAFTVDTVTTSILPATETSAPTCGSPLTRTMMFSRLGTPMTPGTATMAASSSSTQARSGALRTATPGQRMFLSDAVMTSHKSR